MATHIAPATTEDLNELPQQLFGPYQLERAKYEKYIQRMRGGAFYFSVAGRVKAAMDLGILLGSETFIEDSADGKAIRVTVRIKVLNKHIPNYEQLPPDLQYGYYDGVADNPKTGGQGAAANFPLEDAQTSALGRALGQLGLVFDSFASAEEIQIASKKQSSGYETALVTRDQVAKIFSILKSQGVGTRDEANAKAVEMFGQPIGKITSDQASEWISKLEIPF